jgi:hypothetical protein
MRTTLTIDDDIYELAISRSRATGESLGKVVSELARQGLRPMQSLRMVKKGRFPLVELPSDAQKIDPRRVREAWEKDGVF